MEIALTSETVIMLDNIKVDSSSFIPIVEMHRNDNKIVTWRSFIYGIQIKIYATLIMRHVRLLR